MAGGIGRRAVLAGLTALPLVARANGPFEAAFARAAGMERLRALVVSADGMAPVAEAFRGPPPARPVNVKSVSKTVVAILTGIAIARGALPGPEARLGDIAPELIPAGADPAVADITLADLASMQAGLERTSGPNYGAWVASPNWVADALSRPMVARPGARFLYSTGSFHILGAVLSARTGQSLLDLARDWLGRPLGIDIPPWTQDPQGRFLGGNNMALSPLAMARIGDCVRAGGRWDGRRVIPEDWIAASLTPRTRSPFSGDQYGYGWFLREVGGERAAYGRGYGGQMLWIFRDAGLTVAVTSDPSLPARSHGYVAELHALVAETILPGIGVRP